MNQRYALWWPGISCQEYFGFSRTRNRSISALIRSGFIVLDGGFEPPKNCIQIAFGQPFNQKEYRKIWDKKDGVLASIGFTVFESTNLHPGWADSFRQHDACWTSSKFCQKIFQKEFDAIDLKIPNHVIPNGVDSGCFPPMNRPIRGDSELNPFIFLWTGLNPKDRKRGEFVEEVFKKIKLPNTHLIMKYSPLASFNHIIINKRDNISYICDYWSDEEYRSALFNADCFVQPSRCEGFGMEPLEALATGLPIIITNYSGYQDYLLDGSDMWRENYNYFMLLNIDPKIFSDESGHYCALGYPLKWNDAESFYNEEAKRIEEALKSGLPIGNASLLQHMYNYGKDALVSEDELATAMIYNYENQFAMKELAKKSSNIIHSRWSWNAFVEKVVNSLTELNLIDLVAWNQPRKFVNYIENLRVGKLTHYGPYAKGKEIETSDDVIENAEEILS